MNIKTIFWLALACLFLQPALQAQPTNETDSTIRAELQKMQQEVMDKASAGKTNEADYADELKSLDAMIASKKDAKTDEAVQYTYMKAMLYLEVIKDNGKGADIMRQIITNYPNTPYSESATKIVNHIAGEQAAEESETNSVDLSELKQVIDKIQVKVDAGKTNEADYADEIKALDQMIGDYKGTNIEQIARAAYNKGKIYLELFQNTDRGTAILKEIEVHYPDTKFADEAADLIGEVVQMQLANEQLQEQTAQFTNGQPLPDFDLKDLDGKPISLARLKGKVVLLDFWATWCEPCMVEMPNIIATYQKHHGEGLEIIGATSDDDQHALNSFLQKQKDMAWPEYFDGKGSDNEMATKYGIKVIPFNILLDRDGKIIGASLRGPKLEEAVTKALAAK
jgi:thiol-disulfide isomerase/thioredoxin